MAQQGKGTKRKRTVSDVSGVSRIETEEESLEDRTHLQASPPSATIPGSQGFVIDSSLNDSTATISYDAPLDPPEPLRQGQSSHYNFKQFGEIIPQERSKNNPYRYPNVDVQSVFPVWTRIYDRFSYDWTHVVEFETHCADHDNLGLPKNVKEPKEGCKTSSAEVYIAIEDNRQVRIAVPNRKKYRKDFHYFCQAINLCKSPYSYFTELQLFDVLQDIDKPCKTQECADRCAFENDSLVQSTLDTFLTGLYKGFEAANPVLLEDYRYAWDSQDASTVMTEFFERKLDADALALSEEKRPDHGNKSARDLGMKISGNATHFQAAAYAIINDWMRVDHSNGNGKAWGNALMKVAQILVSHSRMSRTHRDVKIIGRSESFGGQGTHSPYQSKVAYVKILPEPLQVGTTERRRMMSTSDRNWGEIDKALFEHFNSQDHLPTTTLGADYLYTLGNVVVLSGESLSKSVVEDILKILVSSARLLTYFDFAFGMISSKRSVIFVIVRSVDNRYIYAPYEIVTRPNIPNEAHSETAKDITTYINAMGRVISVLYKIVAFMSIQNDKFTRDLIDKASKELLTFQSSDFARARDGTDADLKGKDVLYLFHNEEYRALMQPELQKITFEAAKLREANKRKQSLMRNPAVKEYVMQQQAILMRTPEKKPKIESKGAVKDDEPISLYNLAAKSQGDRLTVAEDGEVQFNNTQDMSDIF